MSVFLLDQPARLACCRIKVRKTSLEMPMPPDLAKDFEYSSVSIERQTPVPVVSPNGPSPLTPVVICENIELRNIASNSWALARVFFCASGETLVSASASCRSLRPLISEALSIPIISHHLDVGLDRAGGLDRLQDADQVARADAKPVEAVDQLLQRDAVLDEGEFLAVLGDPDAGARRHDRSSARQRIGLADDGTLGNRNGEIAL